MAERGLQGDLKVAFLFTDAKRDAFFGQDAFIVIDVVVGLGIVLFGWECPGEFLVVVFFDQNLGFNFNRI